MPSSGSARCGLTSLRRQCSPLCLCWLPASGLLRLPPFQPRRLHNSQLAPLAMLSTRRRYNPRACARSYILQSSCPIHLPLSPQPTPGSSASASTPGLRRLPRSLAMLPTGSRLAPRTPLPHGLATSSNSHRVPHTLLARSVTPGLRPLFHACGSADNSTPGLRLLLHPSAKLATSSRLSVGCRISGLRQLPASRLFPFPESFGSVLVGLPTCAGPQLPHSTFVRPRISPVAGSLGLRGSDASACAAGSSRPGLW